jgi:hypothetical protein
MSERPRTVWIGTDTPFFLEAFKDERTGQFLTGITDGKMTIHSEVPNPAVSSIVKVVSLIELSDEEGTYEALVPADQAGFLSEIVEGQPLRLQFDISGGAGLTLRLDAKAVARVKKDDGL